MCPPPCPRQAKRGRCLVPRSAPASARMYPAHRQRGSYGKPGKLLRAPWNRRIIRRFPAPRLRCRPRQHLLALLDLVLADRAVCAPGRAQEVVVWLVVGHFGTPLPFVTSAGAGRGYRVSRMHPTGCGRSTSSSTSPPTVGRSRSSRSSTSTPANASAAWCERSITGENLIGELDRLAAEPRYLPGSAAVRQRTRISLYGNGRLG